MIAINTNITALSVYNQTRLNELDFNTRVERLTSGTRVNRGGDDPSGLGIAVGMRGQIEGLATSIGNIQDGVNMIHFLDGVFEVGNDVALRMRDISLKILNTATIDITDDDESSDVNRLVKEMRNMGLLLTKFFSNQYPEFPEDPSTLLSVKPFIQYNGKPILMNGRYEIEDPATGQLIFTEEHHHLTFNNGVTKGEDLQVGPNSGTEFQVNLYVDDIRQKIDDLWSTMPTLLSKLRQPGAKVFTEEEIIGFARAHLVKIDDVLKDFADIRAQLATQENGLKTALGDIQAQYINVSAGRSRIMDADMAVEIAAFTKDQIKEQATTAIASQANAAPLITMKLIGAIYDGLAPPEAMDTG